MMLDSAPARVQCVPAIEVHCQYSGTRSCRSQLLPCRLVSGEYSGQRTKSTDLCDRDDARARSAVCGRTGNRSAAEMCPQTAASCRGMQTQGISFAKIQITSYDKSDN